MSHLFRSAEAADSEPVALLHADSWRRHYRGAYADSYLDGDLETDRRSVWSARLGAPTGGDGHRVAAGRRSGAAERESTEVPDGVAGGLNRATAVASSRV